MDKGALSDLCTICHAETPKYRCPRCKTQTCSLACYKRHQQRASCSGKRDPTTYVKKSQWATPAGVDHDYNYLKTVERSIDGASEDAQTRGIGVATTPSSRAVAKAWQEGSGLQNYLRKNNITVEHAPLGMSRQKTNQTRITKRGNVIWTVEWVDADGERRLQPECSGSMSIEELYSAMSTESRRTTKRRRKESGLPARPEERVSKQKTGRGAVEGSENDAVTSEQSHTLNKDTSSESTEPGGQLHNIAGANIADANASALEDNKDSKEDAPDDAHDSDNSTTTSVRIITETKPDKHFYLLKPGTASKSQVLIPLDSRITLTTSLRGRTVQEYPTIHAFPHHPFSPLAGFVLESEYLKTQPAAQDRSTTAASSKNDKTGGTKARPGNGAEEERQLDAKSILNMLKRDVTI